MELGVSFYNESVQEEKKIVATIPINSTTANYVFSAMPDEDDLDIDSEEAVMSFANIATAKCIEQKDKRCFLSNVSENTEDSLQIIANNIEVEYVIKEVDYTDTTLFNDYKDENVCFTFKGYQRGEIYSLGFSVIWATGSESFAYHIPGRLGDPDFLNVPWGLDAGGSDLTNPVTTNRIWVAPVNTSATTGECGTYVSTSAYTPDQGYPEDGVYIPGTPNLYLIRHHLMPDLEMQPHFESGGAKIRILGLKFKLNATARAALDALGDRVQAIVFNREPRDAPEKKSIFGQGLTKSLFQTYKKYDAADGNITALDNDAVYKKEPWLGNYRISQSNNTDGIITRRSIGWYPVTENSLTNNYVFASVPGVGERTAEHDKIAFYSPEAYLDIYKLGELSPDVLGTEQFSIYASKLKTVMKLVGAHQGEGNDPVTYNDGVVAGTGNYTFQKAPRAWASNNFVTHTPMSVGETQEITIDTGSCKFVLGGSVTDIGETAQVDNSTSSEFLYLKLNSTLAKPSGGRWDFNIDIDPFARSATNSFIQGGGDEAVLLSNLVNERSDQYGQIGNKPYNIIEVNTDFSADEYECYGGDTFISKYAWSDRETYPFRGVESSWVAFVYSTHWEIAATYWGSDVLDKEGFSFKALAYYFCESMVNPNYQHEDASSYYPKSTINTELTKPYTEANNQAYNKTYSHDIAVQPFFSPASNFVAVGEFETRTYYSQQSVEGEILDAFSVFKANEYEDLPKHTGEIIDSFIHENELYMHTPQTLWKTFVTTKNALSSELGEIYMGTGGVFANPAMEIFTMKGGYGGTTSQWAGCNTPFGRFFVDNRQGKVFLMKSGGGIEEVSAHGMFKDFLTIVTDLTDNPANGSGYHSAYDFKNRRWLLTKTGESGFTLSYHPELKSWTSYHTYVPTHMANYGNRLFMFRNGLYQIHELEPGARGVYFGDAPADSTLSYVVNMAQGLSIDDTKVFDNQEFHTISTSNAGVPQLMDTFDRIQCANEYQDTGEYEILTDNTNWVEEGYTASQLLCRMKNNHFQIALPRQSGADERRLKSKWLSVTLKYLNTPNNKFIISFIKTKLRNVFR
jgi:hypothetical protein